VEVEQWCIRASRRCAEEKRQELISSGLLDRALKPRAEGDAVLLPVTEYLEGAERCPFVAHPREPVLPRHEQIGGIAVMQERDVPGAETLLASRPSLHTVLFPESQVEGDFRTRRFEVLAGTPTTKTDYTEYGLSFAIDLEAAYFSARLASERRRILALMSPGERVLDMFAGVGPFALTLAGSASFVVASDLNPAAVRLMVENIRRNRGVSVLPVLADADRLPQLLPWKFDRVVMNFPLHAYRFLPSALRLCRPGGTIHCYALVSCEGELLPAIDRLPAGPLRERYVRSYSPGRWHAVYDIMAKDD
jgi:tRNA (guanine37-N1)-methyltransferase